MKFEWDEEKNFINRTKHDVWFEEAQTVWADEDSIEFFDEYNSDDEERYLRVGHSSKNRVLLVVFCERDDLNKEVIRIISARRATKKEREAYEKGI